MKKVKKITACILAILMLVSSMPGISLADIAFTENVTLEQDLPFVVSSDTASTSIDVPIPAGYSNVKVLSSTVDNGNITSTSVNSDSIKVNLDNGSRSSEPTTKTVTESNTVSIPTDSIPNSNNNIMVDIPENVTAITAVNSTDGQLKSASGVGTSNLIINVDPTKGTPGFDYNGKTITQHINFAVPSDNRYETVQMPTQTVLPFDINTVRLTDVHGNSCRLYAHNDTDNKPQKGLISVCFSGGPYQKVLKKAQPWACQKREVDRYSDKSIATYDDSHNKIYVKIDPYSIGLSAYTFTLAKDYPLPTYTDSYNKGLDFWGYYMGNPPTISSDSNNPTIFNEKASNMFVNFRDKDKLKIFSTDQLNNLNADPRSSLNTSFYINSDNIHVSSNAIFRNRAEEHEAYNPGEIQTMFEDPLTPLNLATGHRQIKTIVYHWWFWAGPHKWGTLGGIYTYPYKATVEYDQYPAVKFYNGSVTYEYQESMVIPGGKYNYSGKVHIQYTATRTGVDKPPTTPGGVIATKDKIMNGPSTDDYTAAELIRYRYYYYKNSAWNYLGENTGTTEYSWDPASLGLDLLNLRVGVIAVDNRDQQSGRAENDPAASIAITGSLSKTVVKPGDSLDIYAYTDSTPDAYAVDYNIEDKYGSGTMTKNGKKPYEVNINTVSGKWHDYYDSAGGDVDFDEYHTTHVGRYNPQGTYEEFVSGADGLYRTTYKKPQQIKDIKSVVDVSAGGNHAAAVKLDGTAWTWGNNDFDIPQMSHLEQVKSIQNITKVNSGMNFCMALKSDGTVWTWGNNGTGQLGNGTLTNSSKPFQVNISNVIDISAGNDYCLALKSDGTVWTWGGNASGQLGNGTLTISSVPVQISSLVGIMAISAGASHSLALKNNGTVWGWGENGSYQLGVNNTTDQTVPVQIGSLSGITSVSAGGAHSLALTTSGTIYAWGSNSYGQLGNNSSLTKRTPALLTTISGVTAIATGAGFSAALKNDGTIWTWGDNTYGQLGNNSTTKSLAPIQAIGISNATKIDAGRQHCIAVKSDGGLCSWGNNSKGQLGINSTVNSLAPASVSISSVNIAKAGYWSTIVLKNDGTVWTCGNNTYGELGYTGGIIDSTSTPVQAPNLSNVTKVSAGENHYLFLKSDGTVWAYGNNTYGQLGNGTTDITMGIVQVSGLTGITAIAAGESHSIALKNDGTVWAWGYNNYGQLGNGSSVTSSVPVRVSNITGVTAIAAGSRHNLALKSDGTVWAWGDNSCYQIGDGYTTTRRSPVQSKGITGAIAIGAGDLHSLAVLSNGTVRAWGKNSSGQIGCGDTDIVSSPISVNALTNVSSVKGGNLHSAALKNDGTVWAWGSNRAYQVYDNSKEEVLNPVNVDSSLTNITAIASGNSFNIALKNDGTLWSWGSGALGYENEYVCGKQGTIVIPDFNRYGYSNADYLSIAGLAGQNSISGLGANGVYIANTYIGNTSDISPCSSNCNNTFGTMTYFLYTQNYNDLTNSAYSYQQPKPTWATSGGYIRSICNHIQIWDQRVSFPYWNMPVVVTFNDKVYKVYQNGTFIAQVTANRSMEGQTLTLPQMRSSILNESSNSGGAYSQFGSSTGKTVLTDKVWTLDNINTYMAAAYNDNYYIANPTNFRQPQALTDNGDGFYTLDYGGVRSDSAPHPSNLSDYLDGTIVWKKTITIPSDITAGYHDITLTAKNGLTKSINLAFFVDIPEVLNPKGSIPYYVKQGKTYVVTAKSTKQASNMSLVIFGTSRPMTYTGIDSSDPDYPDSAKCWSYNVTIPADADYGLYSQATGVFRMAEFKAVSALGRTESDYKPFDVLVYLNPVGNIPDSIETGTPWKATCTTNVGATSVSVSIDPSPGASPYKMTLVSNDGSHKHWETTNLQYPEGSAGSESGKLVTGTFTAKGPDNSVETDIDTGRLYEKIEFIGYELRRLLYKDNDKNKPVVETLCRSLSTRKADSVGFVMAGQEMGIKIMTNGYVDRIEMDIIGPTIDGVRDNSAKTLDSLTKRFEWDDPTNKGKTPFTFKTLGALKDQYAFPKDMDNSCNDKTSLNNIYTTYYLIPYGTKQTLHSWYTLRQESGDAFNIDKARLLQRIKEPFTLRLKLYSGSRYITKDIKFDVFERWDTLLNRDIRPYIDNPGDHDPVDKHRWETTNYVE